MIHSVMLSILTTVTLVSSASSTSFFSNRSKCRHIYKRINGSLLTLFLTLFFCFFWLVHVWVPIDLNYVIRSQLRTHKLIFICILLRIFPFPFISSIYIHAKTYIRCFILGAFVCLNFYVFYLRLLSVRACSVMIFNFNGHKQSHEY